jgi:hypothetical protein
MVVLGRLITQVKAKTDRHDPVENHLFASYKWSHID